MALALLAAEWVAVRGGALLCLTVDHGLRPEAAVEAQQVDRWLAARGIPHRILRHGGPRPTTGIQQAARAIRYDLLAAECRSAGILHLLLAHHRDDQAETVAIRAGRSSGPDGIAGMAACRETEGPRLLRPLLGMPRTRLAATLVARGQPWIDDPSNSDPRFERVRLRGDGIDAEPLLSAAVDAARSRAGAERQVARAAADLVWLAPEGYAIVDADGVARLPADIGRRLLQGLVTTIGNSGPHGARGEGVERVRSLLGGMVAARTLGGCRIVPWRGRVLVCRELQAVGPDVAVCGPGILRWDGRFVIAVPPGMPISCRVAPVGPFRPRPDRLSRVPGPARPSLPGIWHDGALLAVPATGWHAREDVPRVAAWFQPTRALAAGPFAVV